LYIACSTANPHLSPELQTLTTVVNFTVTPQGLEEQLLSRVVLHEQKSLDDQLRSVYSEIANNSKSLVQLNESLLKRLTQSQGNLLDDAALMTVLAGTRVVRSMRCGALNVVHEVFPDIKQKSVTVQRKLKAASDTKATLTEKRESYRPAAVCGTTLFFTIQDLGVVNPMYRVGHGWRCSSRTCCRLRRCAVACCEPDVIGSVSGVVCESVDDV
jgi:dynein heavy chain, axonemal